MFPLLTPTKFSHHAALLNQAPINKASAGLASCVGASFALQDPRNGHRALAVQPERWGVEVEAARPGLGARPAFGTGDFDIDHFYRHLLSNFTNTTALNPSEWLYTSVVLVARRPA